MTEPGLFVVCNNCSREVSPYITECPYCGFRLRKRAPDLGSGKGKSGGAGGRFKKNAATKPKGPRRQGRKAAPGLPAIGKRPVATLSLIAAAIVISVAVKASSFPTIDLILLGPIDGDYWQLFTAPLVHFSSAYAFVALLGAAIFGFGIEARFGPFVLAGLWLFCGALGIVFAALIAPIPHANGANGVAVGLMFAWLAVVGLREDRSDIDTYGLLAVCAVLLALPIATVEASIWAELGGAVAGGSAGWVLSRFR